MDTGRFTVAVCSRNRAALLEACLESLVAELGGAQDVEVVVIDNGSEDDIPAVVNRLAGRLSIRCEREDTPGLSRARNLALGLCATPFIVYLDDDAQVDPGWSDAVRTGVATWDPDCFGGPYRPFYLTAKPPWFRDEYGSAHLETPVGPLAGDRVLSGGNMGWRTSLLRELGGFPEHLGMAGDRLGVGEETYLQLRLMPQRVGLRRIFLPDMSIRHLVSDRKLRVGYWLRRAWITGWTHDQLRLEPAPIPLSTAIRLVLVSTALVLGVPLRNRRRHPHWQNHVLERLAPKLKMLAIASRRLLRVSPP